MSLLSLLVLLMLVLLLFGGLPTWGYHGYGYAPSAIGGLLLMVILVMFLSGRLDL